MFESQNTKPKMRKDTVFCVFFLIWLFLLVRASFPSLSEDPKVSLSVTSTSPFVCHHTAWWIHVLSEIFVVCHRETHKHSFATCSKRIETEEASLLPCRA